MRIFNRNSEGYQDPTAGEAFLHITHEENLLHRQETAERKACERQAQSARRKQETLQMLKHLDETNGWKLSWTNPNPSNAIKQRKVRHEKNPCND